MCNIRGRAQVQMKIIFLPRVGKHFWRDWSHTLDDSLSEIILLTNVFEFLYFLLPKKCLNESDLSSYLDLGVLLIPSQSTYRRRCPPIQIKCLFHWFRLNYINNYWRIEQHQVRANNKQEFRWNESKKLNKGFGPKCVWKNAKYLPIKLYDEQQPKRRPFGPEFCKNA